MIQNRLAVSSTALILGAQVIAKVVGFFFLVFVARVLGVSVYGTYAFIISLIGILSVLADFGLNTITVRTLSREPERVSVLFWANAAIRVPLWTALVGLMLGVLALLNRTDLFLVALLFSLGVFPVILGQVVTSILNGLRRYTWIAMLILISVAVPVAAGFFALRSGYGLVGLAVAAMAGSSVQAIVALRLSSTVGVKFGPSFPRLSYLRGLVAQAFPLGLSLLFVTVYYKIDRVLIGALLGEVYVGWYDVAYRFLDGLMVIPSSLVLVLFPLFSRLLPTDPGQPALDAVRRGTRWMFALALPIAAALSLLALPLVGAVFGGEYVESARVLRLLAWAAALMFPNALLGNALVAADKQNLIALIVGTGVILNIALNLALIPWFGIDGAAIATIATEAWGFLGVTYCLGKHLRSYAFLLEILRPAAVAFVIGATIVALKGLPFLALLPLLAFSYLVFSFLFRSLDVGDAASFFGLRGRLGRSVRLS